MSVIFIYRSVGTETSPNKVRANYFSKLKCLRSFLAAVKKMDDYKIIFLNDSSIPEDRLTLMQKNGEVINLGGIGNIPSFLYSVDLASKTESDLAYFAEDDYVYMENAFTELLYVAKTYQDVDYFTLFDSPHKYIWKTNFRSHILLGKSCYWRTEPATCCTFGGRTKIIKKDRRLIHALLYGAVKSDPLWKKMLHRPLRYRLSDERFHLSNLWSFMRGGTIPWDNAIWQFLIGRKRYFWKFPKRTLLGPIYSLASHLDGELPRFVDWERISNQY